jgi:hypothetical protein
MGPWRWQIGPFAWERYGDMRPEIQFSSEPFETWRHVAWGLWRRVG